MVTLATAAEREPLSSSEYLPGLEPAPGSCAAAQGRNASVALALVEYRDLLERRLAKPLRVLFYQLTGLHLHLCWHEPTAQRSHGVPLRPEPEACQAPAAVLRLTCREYRKARWLPEWSRHQWEEPVPGRCGFINYCACFKLPEQPLLTLLVQQPTPTSRAAKQAFSRATSLAKLIVHDLRATLQAGHAAAELDYLHEETVAGGCRREVAGADRSRAALGKRRLPETLAPKTEVKGRRPKTDRNSLKSSDPAQPRQSPSGDSQRQGAPRTHPLNSNRRQQLVQRMLDYIHQHYCRPIQLHDLAVAMQLNPSYVSSLFSTTLGVTFHQYLEQLRIARAKDFLRDPVKRISDVAYAVGYPNPNHFRNVFVTRVGVPPSAWREMQAA